MRSIENLKFFEEVELCMVGGPRKIALFTYSLVFSFDFDRLPKSSLILKKSRRVMFYIGSTL